MCAAFALTICNVLAVVAAALALLKFSVQGMRVFTIVPPWFPRNEGRTPPYFDGFTFREGNRLNLLFPLPNWTTLFVWPENVRIYIWTLQTRSARECGSL